MTETFSILTTKLYRPPLQADFVPRPQLLEEFDGWQQRPLTLISASAGYGKTTLVSSWLETVDLPSAWVSLDRNDDDLIQFLAYFIAAIRTIFPDALQDTLALVKAPEQPPVQTLANSLINGLDQIAVDYVLVLDDYQSIEQMDIHDLMSALLRYPPPSMHLILATRSDPPLDLIKLRAQNRTTEIRAQKLRFNQAEAAEYLRKLLNRPVDLETAVTLTEKAEGWVTGIRLLALSLNRIEKADWTQIDSVENNQMVEDYLMSIILTQQEPAFEERLLQTAVLDRFCAPLCDTFQNVDQESGSSIKGEKFIQQLLESNLFVIPLDTQGNWFRYHHLFRDLLLRQLEKRKGQAIIASLHHEASTWLVQNGFIEEALRHVLATGDTTAAIELVAQHRHNLLNQEKWYALRRWLNMFPHQLVEEEPELLIATAWILYNRSQYPDMVAVLNQAETLLELGPAKTIEDKRQQAEIDAMRCEYVLVYEVDPERAVALAQRALSEIPQEWFNVRGLAYVILGYGYLMLGDPQQGFAIIYDVLKRDKSDSSMFRARLLTALCFLHYSNADMPELGQAAAQLLKLGQTDNLTESAAYAGYFLGCYHYLRNELEKAEEHLIVTASDRRIAQVWSTIQSACVLVLTYQAIGRVEQAQNIAENAIAYLAEIENVEFLPQLHALQAELALRQEHLGEAGRWARQFDPYPLPLMTMFYIPQLTLAKVLLAQDTAAGRKQAGDLLAKLYDHVLTDKRFMIEVLSLQALLDDASGDQVGALDKLERAIHLADPGDFIRLFVDLGPKMAGLLSQLRKQSVATHHINQILDAFGTGHQSADLPTEPGRFSDDGDQPPVTTNAVDALTNREFEVLTLIAQGLSNKEIAAQLVIAPGTVSQYNHIIYQKLMVKNRRQAVVEATKLGVLPLD